MTAAGAETGIAAVRPNRLHDFAAHVVEHFHIERVRRAETGARAGVRLCTRERVCAFSHTRLLGILLKLHLVSWNHEGDRLHNYYVNCALKLKRVQVYEYTLALCTQFEYSLR